MRNAINLFDYDADWALKEDFLTPRSTPGYLTREEVIAFFGTLEIDEVELKDEYWGKCSAAYIKQVTSEAGLPISTYWAARDLALPPDQQQAVVKGVCALMDKISEMGARYTSLVPALAKQGIPLSEQRDWLVEGLRQCAEYGGSIGLTLSCEDCDWDPIRPLMGGGRECREICEAVDSPHFRLVYDVGAPLFVGEDPLVTLREMMPYATNVHLKNYRPISPNEKVGRYLDANDGQRYTGALLDQGIVDIPAIVSELHRLGYDGPLLIEYQGEEDPRTALRYNLDYLKGLLAKSGTGT